MLLLDLGNSAIKAQYWRAGELQSSCRIHLVTGWHAQFKSYLSSIRSDNCYYAGVARSDVCKDVMACLREQLNPIQLRQLKPLAQAGKVINAYAEPQTIGVDRWLALLATSALTPTDAIVIDAGSAITIDLLKASGEHLGGAIMPGFHTTLARFRRILPSADFAHPDIAFVEDPGVSTERCIHINHTPGDIVYLQQLINRWFHAMEKNAMLIVSGGDAHRIPRHRQHDTRWVPDLVFQGMRQQLEYSV